MKIPEKGLQRLQNGLEQLSAIPDRVKRHGEYGTGYPPEIVVKDAISALKKRTKPTIITGPRF